MEWMIVNYPRVRDVFVNTRRWGQTNHLLVIGPGTWTISLGQPVDYLPEQQPVTVANTTAASPQEVTFAPA